MKYKIIKKCQICNSRLFNFLNLGEQPLCDDLRTQPNNNYLYKTKIIFCKKCLTAFQKYNLDKKKLFPKNYHYRASNTADVINGMKNLVSEIQKIKKLKNLNVLDIGCNDGSLLDIFKKKGSITYGIEPTNAYKEAKKKGHIIFNNYFDYKFSQRFIKKIKKIDIITFTNVFAHIENFSELIKSLKNLVSNKTLIVIENHYLGEVIKKNQFDTFYHEHTRTYSLNSFEKISKLLGLSILDYKFVKRYNGNIRVLLGSTSEKIKKYKIKKDLKEERKLLKHLNSFQKKINLWKKNKKNYFNLLLKKYGKLPAKAFPGRASILINLLKVDNKYISAVYEKNTSLKVNKFVPGTNIKILKEKYFNSKERKKNIIINLAWHIKEEIRNYVKYNLKFDGKIIDIVSKKDFE